MPSFHTTRRVRHAPEKMFDLVADVEQYPRFVPLCESLTVRLRRPLDNGAEVLVADMTVAYALFRETFTSKVTLDRPHDTIVVEYLDGPFRHLENRWTFEPDGEGCHVGFWINYEFKSRALGALMGAMFDKAFRRFSEAFEERADAVYG
ncbi:MAG TPA: type II toxin-antitoxin system RatA family toxin [Methylomirabilota bacterium]|nr:type II toxin-antitoxin system RatA family toxin [Methylomirabilota bacterium]